MLNIAIILFFSLFWLSGIISFIITYNIAPAAKLKKNGNIYLTLITNNNPKIADIGSTIPLNEAIKKDFNLL